MVCNCRARAVSGLAYFCFCNLCSKVYGFYLTKKSLFKPNVQSRFTESLASVREHLNEEQYRWMLKNRPQYTSIRYLSEKFWGEIWKVPCIPHHTAKNLYIQVTCRQLIQNYTRQLFSPYVAEDFRCDHFIHAGDGVHCLDCVLDYVFASRTYYSTTVFHTNGTCLLLSPIYQTVVQVLLNYFH